MELKINDKPQMLFKDLDFPVQLIIISCRGKFAHQPLLL